jgi:tetratricopeptide (TPR) repeat protein
MKEIRPTSFFGMRDERFKGMLAVMIAVITTLTAFVAFLQGDAATRDDRANTESKRYALEAMGRQVSGDARVNYDYNTAYQSWYELNSQALEAANNGDDAAARRYEKLRDLVVSLSPLLASPYFDPSTKELDIARYEADTYLVEITELQEMFISSANVKEAWDYKANTYIMHLTLLAVSIFLLGMAATIARPSTRWIFLGTGLAIAFLTVLLVIGLWLQPVEDLRKQGDAIHNYALGVGMAHQEKWVDAIGFYDKAIQAASNYANALARRGEAYYALDDYDQAVTEYEAAQSAGDQSATTAGMLAYVYYLQGRFNEAINMNQMALKTGPDELWIQYDLGLSQLAAGQIDTAKAEYAKSMQQATRLVAEATASGARTSSDLWWSLDDAALSLDELLTTIDTGEGAPSKDKIANPEAVYEAGESLSTDLKSLSVGLEFTGKPPQGALTAKISPFQFGTPVYDDEDYVVDFGIAETFVNVPEIALLFDYEGMQDGQEVIFKVYVNGEEDPSWRIITQWDQGASGSTEEFLSVAYSETFVFSPGYYTVEMYVDSHLAQSGNFEVTE